jgi:hypothetical protein
MSIYDRKEPKMCECGEYVDSPDCYCHLIEEFQKDDEQPPDWYLDNE